MIQFDEQLRHFFDEFEQKNLSKRFLREKLISIGRDKGFNDENLRKSAWIYFLRTSNDDENSFDEINGRSDDYYDQIRLDAIRTLKRFPPNYSEDVRHDLQDELIVLINRILVKHPELHYYQGYHDISLTFLLVLGKDSSFPLLDSITMSHLKYFMEPTMAKTHEFLAYLMPLINCIDSECAEFIQRGDNGHVTFALPWFITWFSHVLEDLEIILRLYDLFIVSHYLMPIYLAAQIVEYHSDEILTLDCDMATIHQYLSSLPSSLNQTSWEEIIHRTLYLFDKYPPETLDDLTEQWKTKCKFIENSPWKNSQRRRKQFKSTENSSKLPSLSSVALWGITITVGGLAIFLWNQSSTLNPDHLFPFGNI